MTDQVGWWTTVSTPAFRSAETLPMIEAQARAAFRRDLPDIEVGAVRSEIVVYGKRDPTLRRTFPGDINGVTDALTHVDWIEYAPPPERARGWIEALFPRREPPYEPDVAVIEVRVSASALPRLTCPTDERSHT